MISARVTAKDAETGTWHDVNVIVRRRFVLAISCSCWKHRLPFPMDAIETAGGLYFRPEGSDENYREIGHNGPVIVEVESIGEISG